MAQRKINEFFSGGTSSTSKKQRLDTTVDGGESKLVSDLDSDRFLPPRAPTPEGNMSESADPVNSTQVSVAPKINTRMTRISLGSVTANVKPRIPVIDTKNHPPRSYIFPKQTSGPSRNRSVRHKWFDDFKWLHYNASEDSLLCFTCIKACHVVGKGDASWYSGEVELAFLSLGFRNWKDATSKLLAHEKSSFHATCTSLLLNRETALPIHAQLQEAVLKSQKDARICLLAVISSIRYLARSGNAIRGHTNEEGNLQELLEERKLDIPQLDSWLQKRDNYLSPDIQNEIMEIMAHILLRTIIKEEVRISPWFAIISDGTTDESGQEQVSLCIRVVNPHTFIVNEEFVGLYNPDDTRSCTLTAAIKDMLLRLNIPMDRLRGYCFDGASNMSGRHKGVRKLLNDEQPKSVYVHCANHSADLALQEVARKNGGMCDVMCIVKDSSNVILESAKRKKMFDNIVLPPCRSGTGQQKTEVKHLIALCPTRWCTRVKSLRRYRSEYTRVQKTLKEILDSKHLVSEETRSKVRGWIAKLQKYETLFYLNVSVIVFGPCEDLARSLQNPTLTACGAKQAATLLVHRLQDLRSDEEFDHVYSKTASEAEELGLDPPSEPRVRRPPKRYEQKVDAAPPFKMQAKDLLKKEYFEILDLLISELKDRFDQKGLDTLVLLEQLLLDAVQGEVPNEDVVKEKLGPFADDFNISSLHSQLQLLKNLPGDAPTCCPALAEKLAKESETVRDLLQQVVLLLVLTMTIPASAASCERSFSTLRRVKNYLRSTMTQKRLTHAMLLHVHKDKTGKIDLTQVMREFVCRKEERKRVFGKV